MLATSPRGRKVTFVAVGDFNTYAAQLLMTEGERFLIQIVQMGVNMSVSEEQINKDELGELLALRSAGKRTAAGYYNLVSTI